MKLCLLFFLLPATILATATNTTKAPATTEAPATTKAPATAKSPAKRGLPDDLPLKAENCTNGTKVFEAFGSNNCTQKLMKELVKKHILKTSSAKTVTKATVQTFVEEYCSKTLPAVWTCFENRTKACNSDPKTSLASDDAKAKTSVLCTANNTVRTEITALITALPDSFDFSKVCPKENFNNCISKWTAFKKNHTGDAVAAFTTAVTSHLKETVDCLSKAAKKAETKDKTNCPHPGWQAIHQLVNYLGGCVGEKYWPTPYQVKSTYTEAELKALFHVQAKNTTG